MTGSTEPTNRGIDALLPAEIARKAETVGVQKTRRDILSFWPLQSWRKPSLLSVPCLPPLYWREQTAFFRLIEPMLGAQPGPIKLSQSTP